MYKRITLLLTISGGAFTKTRQFNPEHLYTVNHTSYPSFDEVIVVCTDPQPLHNFYQFVEKMVDQLTVPLSIAAGISNLAQAKFLFNIGADRLLFNRALWDNQNVLKEVALAYGKQAVIASIDFGIFSDKVYSYDWANRKFREQFLPDNFEDILPYVGEIMIQDVENDGRVMGADIEAIEKVCKFLPRNIPIHVGSCGIIDWDQFSELLSKEFVDAVAVCDVHHMSKIAIGSLRQQCRLDGCYIRKVIR